MGNSNLLRRHRLRRRAGLSRHRRLLVESLETRRVLASLVYVDDDFAALNVGDPIVDADPVMPGDQGAIFGTDAFAVVQDGVNSVDVGGTVRVFPGVYPESISISSALQIIGDLFNPGDIQIRPPAGPTDDGITLLPGADNVTLYGLQIAEAGRDGINATGVSHLSLRAVEVTNSGRDGFRGSGLAGRVLIDGAVLVNNVGDGAAITNSPEADVELITAQLTDNQRGASLAVVKSLSDQRSSIQFNRDGGIVAEDVLGDVILSGTALNDNDADLNSIGDGIRLTDGPDTDGLAVGGNVTFEGVQIRDSDGAAMATNQVQGILAEEIAGQVSLVDLADPPQASEVVGHQADGATFLGALEFHATNALFAENRGSDGLRLEGIVTDATLDRAQFLNNAATGFTLVSAQTLAVSDLEMTGNVGPGGSVDNVGLIQMTTTSADVADIVSVSDSAITLVRGSVAQNDIALSGITSITLATDAGEDTVTVTPSPGTTFSLDGGDPAGGQGDTLIADVGFGYTDSGTVIQDGSNQPISYQNFETKQLRTSGGAPVVNGSDEDDLLEVFATGSNSGSYRLTTDVDGSAGGPFIGQEITFSNIQSFEFIAGDGIDTMRVFNPNNGVFLPRSSSSIIGGTTVDAENLQLEGGTASVVRYIFESLDGNQGPLLIDGVVAYRTDGVSLQSSVTDHINAQDRRMTINAYSRFTTLTGPAHFALDDDQGQPGDGDSAIYVGGQFFNGKILSPIRIVEFAHPSNEISIDYRNLDGSGSLEFEKFYILGADSTFQSDLTISGGAVDVNFGHEFAPIAATVDLGASFVNVSADRLFVHRPVTTAGSVHLYSVNGTEIESNGAITATSNGFVDLKSSGPIRMDPGAKLVSGDGGIHLETVAHDIVVSQLETAGYLKVQAATHIVNLGSILDDGDPDTHLLAPSATFWTLGSMGSRNNPITGSIGVIEAYATGNVHYHSSGDFQVGFTGIHAGGQVRLTAAPAADSSLGTGSLEIDSHVTSEYRGPDAIELNIFTGANSNQVIDVTAGNEIVAKHGGIILKTDDSIAFASGSRAQADSGVDGTLFLQTTSPDASTITLQGQITANQLGIQTGHGSDTISLSPTQGFGLQNEIRANQVVVEGGEGDDTYLVDLSLVNRSTQSSSVIPPTVSIDDALGNDSLRVVGNGLDESWNLTGQPAAGFAGVVARSAPGLGILPEGSALQYSAAIESVEVLSASGLDTVLVNASATAALALWGGSPNSQPGDQLVVDAQASAVSLSALDVSIGGSSNPIRHAQFESIRVANASELNLTGYGGNDKITLRQNADGSTTVIAKVQRSDGDGGFLPDQFDQVVLELTAGQSLRVIGGGGEDAVEFIGHAGTDVVTQIEGGFQLGENRISLLEIESLKLDLGGGANSATLGTSNDPPLPGIVQIVGQPGESTAVNFVLTANSAEPRITFHDSAPDGQGTDDSADLVEGVGGSGKVWLVGIGEIRMIGDGDDRLTVVATGLNPSSKSLQVTGDGQGNDLITGAGSSSLSIRNLDAVTIESAAGIGAVEFELAGLSGANSYTANLQATDVVTVKGSDGRDDELTVGRYGNAWHPVGAQVSHLGATVQMAGGARMNVQGGAGDDIFIVDVDANRGSDVIALPLRFDGGEGGYDVLEFIGQSTTQIDEVIYRPGPDTHNGRVDFEDTANGQLMTVEFTGLEPVRSSLYYGTATVVGTQEPETIRYEAFQSRAWQTGMLEDWGRVRIGDKEVFEFQVSSRNTRLGIDGNAGDDHYWIDLTSSDLLQLNLDDQGFENNRVDFYESVANSVDTYTFTLEADRTRLSKSSIDVWYTGILDTHFRGMPSTQVSLSDSVLVKGTDAAERIVFDAADQATRFQSIPDNGSPSQSFTLTGFPDIDFELGGGFDTATILGTDADDDLIKIFDDRVRLAGGQFIDLAGHDLVRVEAGLGDDKITIDGPVMRSVVIDGGIDGHDLLHIDTPASLAVHRPLQDVKSGRLEVDVMNSSILSVDYQGIDVLETLFQHSDAIIRVLATPESNDITISQNYFTEIDIDSRTALRIAQLSASARIAVLADDGADRIAIAANVPNLVVSGGLDDSTDTVTYHGELASYRLDPAFDQTAILDNGVSTVTLHAFEEIIADVDVLSTTGRDRLPSRSYRVAASGQAGAKAVGLISPSPAGKFPVVSVLAADGQTILNDPNQPAAENGGAVVVNAGLGGRQHVLFDVADSTGEVIPDFELFAAVIEPEEFVDEQEPNNSLGDEIAVTITHNHRVARRGSLPLGDTDLIAVTIDHNHRIALIVNHDPQATGLWSQTKLEVLSLDGETVIASHSSGAGASAGGLVTNPLPAGEYLVRIENLASAVGTDYELVLMDVDEQRAQTDGLAPIDFQDRADVVADEEFVAEQEPNDLVSDEISVTITHNHHVAKRGTIPFGDTDLISVTITHNHRIAAIVDNDPLASGLLTPTDLQILGPDGVSVVATGSNLGEAPSNRVVTPPLPAGTYFVRLSNPVAGSPSEYGLVLFDVAADTAFDDSEDGSGLPFATDLDPGEYSDSNVPASPGYHDLIELTPQGHGESVLRLNDATPVQLRGNDSLTLAPGEGTDHLRVIGTSNSDVFGLLASELIVNGQTFLHGGIESFAVSAGSGDDVFALAEGLLIPGMAQFDGADGTDQLIVNLAGNTADLMLPGVIQDSRLLVNTGVERFELLGGSSNADIRVTGASSPSDTIKLILDLQERLHLFASDNEYQLTTAGTVTISSAVTPFGDTQPIRRLQIDGSLADDLIEASDLLVDLGAVLKSVALDGIGSLLIDGREGYDEFRVTPSAQTRFHIAGGDPIGFGDSLQLQTTATTTFHPGPQSDEGAYQISGALPVTFDQIESHQAGAPLFELVLDVDGTSNIPVPPIGPLNEIVARRNGENFELFESAAGQLIHAQPLDTLRSVKIVGSSERGTAVIVDMSAGGFFELSDGFQLQGGNTNDDSMQVIGSGVTASEHSTMVAPLGPPQLLLSDQGQSLDLRYEDFESVAVQAVADFSSSGLLDVGSGNFRIEATNPVDLGGMTMVDGGQLSSTSTLVLQANESLIGRGEVVGPIAGDLGSSIRATGPLSIGDPASPIGFATQGELYVGPHRVTLQDENQAVLGSLTTLGEGQSSGQLTSSGGLLIDFGNNLVGFGVIETPNSAFAPVINNGEIAGSGIATPITLEGFVKGVGSLDHVVIAGTHSPGLSPAVVQTGSVTISSGGALLMEIGGRSPGSNGHDQIDSAGTLGLDGTLDLRFIDGFVPVLGDIFVLATAAEGVSGQFENIPAAANAPGLEWLIRTESNRIIGEIVASTTPLTITLVRINDGSEQRSGVGSLTIGYDGPINAQNDAYTLINRGTGGVVETEFIERIEGALTFVDFTFSGNSTRGLKNVLEDGNYQLTIDATKVHHATSGAMLDGDNNGVAGGDFLFGASEVDRFFAFFGDTDGDRDVDGADVGRFGLTFRKTADDEGFNPALDYLGDGDVDGADVGQLGQRFRKQMVFE